MFELVRALLALEDLEEQRPFDNVRRLVDFLRDYGTYPPFFSIEEGVNEPECVIEGRRYLMFTANNYLSLSEHPAVKAAAIEAVERYGVGPGGSRVMSGNVDILEELEGRIAQLTGMEACLTFPTGYMANVSVFQAVMNQFLGRLPYERKRGLILVDELVHGSAMDGCRLSGIRTLSFKHGDLGDLRRLLEQEKTATNKLIVTEGVYCLEGEIVDVPAYVETARAYGAKLMIDDAHAVGVIGPRGGGSLDHHGLREGVDILMGCMDKAMGGTGGYLCGSRPLIDYLRIAANATMLSSALPCMMAGAMLAAIDQIEQGSETRAGLRAKSGYLKAGLRRAGFEVMGPHDLPSVPMYIGDEELGIEFAQRLRNRGIYVIIMRWPGVPAARARFRFSLMARHETHHLDHLIEACTVTGRELGMIA